MTPTAESLREALDNAAEPRAQILAKIVISELGITEEMVEVVSQAYTGDDETDEFVGAAADALSALLEVGANG